MRYVHRNDITLMEEEVEEVAYTSRTNFRVRWVAEIDAALMERTPIEGSPGAWHTATGVNVRMRRYGVTGEQALDNLINAIQEEGWSIQ